MRLASIGLAIAVTHREVLTTSPASIAGVVSADRVVLRAAVAAYLGRYRGASRLHTESDLRIFLTWCGGQDLDPLATARVDIDLAGLSTDALIRWRLGMAQVANWLRAQDRARRIDIAQAARDPLNAIPPAPLPVLVLSGRPARSR